jgi:hypothetical protein
MRVSVFLNRNWFVFLVLVFGIYPVVAQSQEAGPKLQAKLGPDVATYWNIVAVGLVPETQGTTASLKIQNASDAALSDVIFYAEYFDSEGRRCFSLVFSQATNVGDEQTAIPAGATRSLYSSASGMMPATVPTEVRIHLLQQARVGQSPARIESVAEQSPVTLGESIPKQAPIHLPSLSESADLLLARVTVDQDGEVRETKILSAMNPQVTAWFQSIVHVLNFYPATTDGRPKNADTLVSVRAVFSPSENPPLTPNSYTTTFKNEVPPVNRILLGPAGSPGTLRVARIGSQWSATAYKWVRDDNMPHHVARQLANN